jgi:hypothetical protein
VSAQISEPNAPGQDEADWLRAYFDNSRNGFFVEVGVRSVSAGSLTWPLEASGWDGVLVEAQPDVASFLVTARSAKVFAVACVAPDVAGRPMQIRVASPLAAVDIGSSRVGAGSSYVITVPTRTLDDILREAEAPVPLDLLTLRAHGLELDALLGFDFNHWRPRLVVIADPAIDLDRHRFLTASGYRAVRRAHGFGWYVPEGSTVPGERLLVLREYWLKLPFRKARRLLSRFNERILSMPD